MSRQLTPPVSAKVLAGWQRELQILRPTNELTSHLRVVWEPGEDWEILEDDKLISQRVERFFVYDMIPRAFITDEEIIAELEGPRPKVSYDRVKKEVWTDSLITRTQWDLYRETKHFGRPFWVIQGTEGGHLRFFNQYQQNTLKLLNLPDKPPLPGDLPYAPFDQRALDKLAQHDRLMQLNDKLTQFRLEQGPMYQKFREANEKEFRMKVVEFIKTQVVTGEMAKEIVTAIKRDNLDVPIVDTDFNQKWEEAEERFVETGSMA